MSPKHLENMRKEALCEAKREYKKRRMEIESSHKIRMEEYYLKTGAPRPQNPPKRHLLEEIGNSVTHGIGSTFAIVAYVLMMLAADTDVERVSATIYFLGMFIMFTSSCLYHAFAHGSAVKRLFRRFDYSSIYLLIGATFAPALLCLFGEGFGRVFFLVQWAIIIFGITLIGIYGPAKLRYIHIPLYVILGWSALMLLPGMVEYSFPLMLFVLLGGVIYSLGIIPFAMRMKVSHFIWHFFVLAGAVVQWIGIYLYLFK